MSALLTALLMAFSFCVLWVVIKFAVGKIVREIDWWKAFIITLIVFVVTMLVNAVLTGAVLDISGLFNGPAPGE